MPASRAIHYVRKNFDSEAIVTSLTMVALTDDVGDLDEGNHAVLAALRRSNSILENLPLPEVQYYLRGLDEAQIPGLVSILNNSSIPKYTMPILHN